jgi:PAS domain S-box-containing protein
MVAISQRRASLAVPYHIILIFLFLALLIALSGYIYYRNQKLHIKKELQHELAAIADLKIEQITGWRSERLADAKAFMENDLLAAEVKRWLNGGKTQEGEKNLRKWLISRLRNYDYSSVLLLDPQGRTLLAEPRDKENIGPGGRKAVAEAVGKKTVFLSDLHRVAIEPNIHIDLVIPLLLQNAGRAECVAVIFMRIDPHRFFYPLVQSWPTPSPTAETLLVRRDGNKIVFLNELRHRKNTALALSISVERTDIPAVMAVRGKQGVVEGIDYRGVPVIAILKPIPDTPWSLVSKVDKEEIYQPVYEQARNIIIMVLLMIAAAGAVTYLYWRRQELEAQQKQYEAERERSIIFQRYNELWQQANDSILLFNGDWNMVEVNDRALITYGYTRDEFLQLKAYELRAPEDRESLEVDLKKAEQYGGFVYETLHQRKDGSAFPVEASTRRIEIEGQVLYQNIIRNITERKAAEEALQESEQSVRRKLDAILSPEGDISSLQLADIFDIPALQSLMDSFNQLVHMTMAILDINGTVLVSAGFQDICTKFHRQHPEACQHCLESDTQLSAGVPQGACKLYKCRNNLWDIATPIYVGGGHVGNLFAGQFFFEDETPDYELFREQARRYGFNEQEYLAALGAVPRVSRKYVDACMAFFMKFSDIISTLSYGNIKLAQTLSERDALMDSLRESEERFKAIADYTVDWESWVWTDGRLLWVNPSVSRITGYSPQECLAMSDYPLPLVHPEDRAALAAEFSAALRGSKRENIESRIIRKDGEVFWGSVSYQPILDSAGNPSGHRSSVRDITERKRAEEALRESEERFRSMAENISDGLMIIEGNRPVFINDRACEITGYSREELMHMKTSEIIVPEYKPRIEETEKQFQKTGTLPRTLEFQIIHKDGTKRFVSNHYSISQREGGIITRYIITADITERKQAEEELRRLYSELEARVLQRTAQLVAANKELEAFAYSVSHDLRAPLRSIAGFSQAITEQCAGQLDEKGKDYFGRVQAATGRMAELIDDLLDLSKITRSEMTFSMVDLSAIAGTLNREQKAADPGRTVEFVIHKNVQARGDERLLAIALSNLFNNAWKFTTKHATARIEFGVEEASGDRREEIDDRREATAEIRNPKPEPRTPVYYVRDDGAGFDMTYAHKLFGPFQRLHQTADFPGTGIGLAIVQRVIHRHGGRVWAEGEVEKGATIYFTLG